MATYDGGTAAGGGTQQWAGPQATPQSPYAQSTPARPAPGLGWLFLAPALVLVLLQQVIPVVRTAWLSLQQVDLFGAGSTPVGLGNYADVLGGMLVPWTLRGSVVLGLVLAVTGFLIGFALGRLGSRSTGIARRIGMALAALGLVGIAPAATVLGLTQWVDFGAVGPPAAVVVWLPVTIIIGFFIAVALPPARPTGRVALLGTAIAAMVGIALGVQNTSGVLVSSDDPGSAIYRMAFTSLQMGHAAAISTLLLLIVIPLGVVSTRMLLATRLRLRIESREVVPVGHTVGGHPGAGAPRPGSGVGMIVAGVVVLGITLVASTPWMVAALAAPGDPGAVIGGSASPVPEAWPALVRTWLGGSGQVLLAAAVAALAGLGIGYYRPLGERSMPVLLTLLSPLLLIGLLPLLVAHVSDRQELELLYTTLGAMYPQIVAVPLVFVCAYVADAIRSRPGIGAHRPAGPAVATIGLAVTTLLLLRTSDVIWSLIMGDPTTPDATALAVRAWQQGMIPEAIGLLRPLPVLLVVAVIVVLCAAGMRRVRLDTVGHDAVTGPSAMTAYPMPAAPVQGAYPMPAAPVQGAYPMPAAPVQGAYPMPAAPEQATSEPVPPPGGGPHVPGQAWPRGGQ